MIKLSEYWWLTSFLFIYKNQPRRVLKKYFAAIMGIKLGLYLKYPQKERLVLIHNKAYEIFKNLGLHKPGFRVFVFK